MKVKKISAVLYPALLSLFLISIFLSEANPDGKKGVPGRTKDRDAHQTSDISSLLLELEKKTTGFKSLQTEFVQEKNLSMFKEKIILKGRIYLEKPHKIAWHVDEPIKYSVLITDKFIRQWDEDSDSVQEFSVSGNPVFRIVLDQLTAWFSGRYTPLLKDYSVRLRNKHPIELDFIPEETSVVKNIIKTITVIFRKDERYLKQIKFQEVSGDSTTIIFSNTIFDAPVDKGFFRLNPARKLGRSSAPPGSLHILLSRPSSQYNSQSQRWQNFPDGVKRRV